jgi:hypothetical protein
MFCFANLCCFRARFCASSDDLERSKGAAEMLGLQETPNDKTVVANIGDVQEEHLMTVICDLQTECDRKIHVKT